MGSGVWESKLDFDFHGLGVSGFGGFGFGEWGFEVVRVAEEEWWWLGYPIPGVFCNWQYRCLSTHARFK